MRDLGVLTPEVRPYAINNLGQIVGGGAYRDFSGNPPFLYSDGEMIDLNTAIAPASGWHLETAAGINDAGQIVGKGTNAAGHSHAFRSTPIISPQAAVQTAAKPEVQSNAQGNQLSDDQRVPDGLVRIVNRKTGLVLWTVQREADRACRRRL